MKTLALDTSTATASVAVTENGNLLGEYTLNISLNHSRIIMVMVEELLKGLSLTPKDIDLFAAAKGPGSFTGLRVGIATVKGLADGCKKESVGVSTLEAIAYRHRLFSGIVCPLIDARRNNAYYGFYENGRTIKSPDVSSIADIADESAKTEKKVLFVGDCAGKFKNEITDILGQRAVFTDSFQGLCSAAPIAILAEKKYNENNANERLMPEYIIKAYVDQEKR